MRILISPDKYKGTLSAREVADAIARGVASAFPDADIDLCPLADGGDGTIDALMTAVGGTTRHVEVTGPLGDPVVAPLLSLPDGRVVIEMATASGLALIEEQRRDPLSASSRGTGELIRAALEDDAKRRDIVVAIGGSASTDGGTGAASAVGWCFLDRRGRDLPFGGGYLRDLARIDGRHVMPELARASIVAACDVDHPLLGARGAARVFAAQKGASPEQVELLEEGLRVLAERVRAELHTDVSRLEGAGACGGMGAGLAAFFSAPLRAGFDVVADAARLQDRLDEADVVITGEGRLDEQSLGGKTPIAVARLASRGRVPCLAVAGELALERATLEANGIRAAVGAVESFGRRRAFGDASDAISELTERLLLQTFTA